MAKDTGAIAWANAAATLVRYVAARFQADRCERLAAGLTFTSLLAIVPLLAVGFAIFSAFPAFDAIMMEAQDFLFENMVPEVGSEVQEQLLRFMERTNQLTAVGVIFLLLTTVLLLATITRAFNDIWRIRERRSVVARFLVFWAVVSLTPILFGAGLAISGYLFAAARDIGVETVTGPLNRLAPVLPFLLQVAGFTLMFLILPDHPVRRRDALVGGVIAGLLLEVLKRLFGYYLVHFPAYETIYGALATIPIFLVWTYLVWIVVLVGAELTAALPEWRAGISEDSQQPVGRDNVLVAALAILYDLHQAANTGGGTRFRAILRSVPVHPRTVVMARNILEDNRYVARSKGGEWLLTRNLETVTLWDLYRDLGLHPASLSTVPGSEGSGWRARLSAVFHVVADDTSAAMAITLKDLFQTPAGPVPVPETQTQRETPAS